MAVEDYMISCPSKSILGIDCLGCGTQRALVLVFEGKFVEAFQMFPAVYFLIGFLVVVLFNVIDKQRNYSKPLIIFGILTAVTMVISYIYKHFI